MKKKIVAMLLVMVIAVCMLPTYAFADFEGQGTATTMSANFTYTFYDWDEHVYIDVPSTVVCSRTYNRVSPYTKAAQCALYAISEDWMNDSMNPGYPDGIYGDNTYNAVYNYQYNKYMNGALDVGYVDGDTGPMTWPFLYGDYHVVP